VVQGSLQALLRRTRTSHSGYRGKVYPVQRNSRANIAFNFRAYVILLSRSQRERIDHPLLRACWSGTPLQLVKQKMFPGNKRIDPVDVFQTSTGIVGFNKELSSAGQRRKVSLHDFLRIPSSIQGRWDARAFLIYPAHVPLGEGKSER
jgi:hypothetical protein